MAPRASWCVFVWGRVGSSVYVPKGDVEGRGTWWVFGTGGSSGVVAGVSCWDTMALGVGLGGRGLLVGRAQPGCGTVPPGPALSGTRLTRRPQCVTDCGSGQRLLPQAQGRLCCFSEALCVGIEKAKNDLCSDPPLTLISCAALDKFPNFSVPPFPYLQNGNNNRTTSHDIAIDT